MNKWKTEKQVTALCKRGRAISSGIDCNGMSSADKYTLG